MYHSIIFLFSLILFSASALKAQVISKKDTADQNKINIIFIKKLKNRDTPLGRYQELIGNVHLRQQKMDIFCDSGYIYPRKDLRAFGHVKMIQPSHRLYADTLFYNGIQRKARLRSNVKVVDSTMQLSTRLLNYDANNQISYFPNGSIIKSDTATLTSKKGIYYGQQTLAVFSRDVHIFNEKFSLKADSLSYNTRTDVAYFHSPTHINHDSIYIYCEDGYYDSKNNIALLTQHTRFENNDPLNKEMAKGDTIYYDGESKQYFLIGNAMYENEERRVWADTISYNDISKEYSFNGDTRFEDIDTTSNNVMSALYSNFNRQTSEMTLEGKVVLIRPDFQIYTDSLQYNTESQDALAKGQTVVTEPSSGVAIHCENLIKNDSIMQATINPMIQFGDAQDTLWIIADTITSVSNKDTSGREMQDIQAYHRVELWKGNIKVKCDSLFYDGMDSTFYFFGSPIMWVDSTQFTAKLLRIQMKDGRIDSLFLDDDAFVVSSSLDHFYNQIKGDSIQTVFKNAQLDRMHVNNNGETVYYVLDEKNQYIGVNDIDCTSMILFFSQKSIRSIRFEDKPNAVMYPLRQVDHSTLILDGFQWLIAELPENRSFLERKKRISYKTE